MATDDAPNTDGFHISMAGNPPCPVCDDSAMVRVRFQGKWMWDACWLCAEQAEMKYQIEAGR